MINSCPYKFILGIPRKGIHTYRMFGDVALFDYIGTIFLSYIMFKVTSIPFELATVIMFSLGIVFHYLFCIDTHTTKWINCIVRLLYT